MKYDLKPATKVKVKLFGNTAEAIVFWLCCAALIALTILTFFRYYYLQVVLDKYHELGENVNPLIIRLEKLTSLNDSLEIQQATINGELELLKFENEQLKIKVSNLYLQAEKDKKNQKSKLPNTIITLPEF